VGSVGSTGTTSGTVVVNGGVGISENVNIGGNLNITGYIENKQFNTIINPTDISVVDIELASPTGSSINDVFIDIPTKRIYAATNLGISTFTYDIDGMLTPVSSLAVTSVCNFIQVSDNRKIAYIIRSDNQIEVVNVTNIVSMFVVTTLSTYTYGLGRCAVSGDNLWISELP